MLNRVLETAKERTWIWESCIESKTKIKDVQNMKNKPRNLEDKIKRFNNF